jgi:hypothetical protein
MTKFSVSFVWKKFECEICKHEFPSKIKNLDLIDIITNGGMTYNTVEIPKP